MHYGGQMGAVAHYSSPIAIAFCLSLINEIVPSRHLVAEKDSEYKKIKNGTLMHGGYICFFMCLW